MSEHNLVPARIDGARRALAAARDDFERLRIRDDARALEAAAAVLKRSDIQIGAARLVMEAERAIAAANPPITDRAGVGGRGQKNSVPPGNGVFPSVSPGTVRKLRHTHSALSDEAFAAACDQAEKRGEPVTRSILRRAAARIRRARAHDHARPPLGAPVPPPLELDLHHLPEPRHRGRSAVLFRADALDLLPALPEGCADALVTDPPYSSAVRGVPDERRRNADYQRETATRPRYPEMAGNHRDPEAYAAWWTRWAEAARRLLRPGAPAAVFTDWRQYPLVAHAFQAAGFRWRGTAVWDKGLRALPRRGRFRQQAEFLLWGSNGDLAAEPAAPCLPGVFPHPVDQGGGKRHITGKPVALMAALLALAPPGALVLDPFAGSGSTGVAALRTGRRFLGVEIVPEYADLAAERLGAAATGPDG